MIPGRLKNALFSKKIRKASKNRQRLDRNFGFNLGIITDADNIETLELFAGISGKLGFPGENRRIVLCNSEIPSSEEIELLHLNSKEISVSGVFKSEAIRNFLSESYDLLICYFSEKNESGTMLAAETNARLIFGNRPDIFGIYDVEITANDIQIFQQEVIKYYRIFKTE